MKFTCIRNELQPTYAVRDCCRVLVVITSGYYRWKNATPSTRSQVNSSCMFSKTMNPPSAIGESVLSPEFGVRNGTDPHELSRREVSHQYWHVGWYCTCDEKNPLDGHHGSQRRKPMAAI